MPLIVSQDELARITALTKMAAAFPNESGEFKTRKKAWWAEIRSTYGIPADVKLKIGLDTGELRHKGTDQAYEQAPPPAPKFNKVSVQLDQLISAIDTHSLGGVVETDLTSAGTPYIDAERNALVVYVQEPIPA
ncbi:hypothetical protein [Caldimonas sp. KR1-144]|uniref:hypothetical protein n=1 Tax=Caldimonas sp. KR1-144 TaxID=3400911 RepID=UPI003BFCF134